MKYRLKGKLPLVTFGIIVVLVLTQVAWWIYYQLGQNKTVFQMHQSVLSLRVREAVQHINKTFETDMLTHAVYGGVRAFPSFPDPNDIPAGFFMGVGDTVLLNAAPKGLVVAAVRWDALEQAMASEYPELTIERLPQTTEVRYRHGPARHVRLPILIRPKTDYLATIIQETERKSVMFISEGVFLSLMVLIGVYIILVTLRRELAVETRQKNFVLSITHELKSPLASVKLYLQTMLSKNVPEPKRKDFLEHSVVDVERLERLVENMLETARLDSGEYILRPSPVHLSDVVSQSVNRLQRSLQEDKVEVDLRVEENVWVLGDPHALISIVDNIIDNAAKYSLPPKRVEVVLATANGEAVLEVSDSGPGIAEADRPFVFDRFYRAGDEMTRLAKGTGLGLFLVKQLADAHGAKIGFRNLNGTGACFEIRFSVVTNVNQTEREQ